MLSVEEQMREDIARGIALLNEKVPGWHMRIDLDRLDMNSGRFDMQSEPEELDGCGCILAQVNASSSDRGFGTYPTGWYLLQPSTDTFAAAYGFAVPDWGYEDSRSDERTKTEQYEMLTGLWRTAILNIRSTA